MAFIKMHLISHWNYSALIPDHWLSSHFLFQWARKYFHCSILLSFWRCLFNWIMPSLTLIYRTKSALPFLKERHVTKQKIFATLFWKYELPWHKVFPSYRNKATYRGKATFLPDNSLFTSKNLADTRLFAIT